VESPEAENPEMPVASTIGAGIVLNDDTSIGIVLSLGILVDEENPNDPNATMPLGAINMSVDMAVQVANKLVTLISEANFAREAVIGMGHDAALEYMRAFAKRCSAPFN
jgi:hypothetical protein